MMNFRILIHHSLLLIHHFKRRFCCRRAHSDGTADRRRDRIGNVADGENIFDIGLAAAVNFYVALFIQINFSAKDFRVGGNTDAD